MPPLSRKPESFPPVPGQRGQVQGYTFGGPTDATGHFPESRYRRCAVLLPERFRGGCSFGAGAIRKRIAPNSPALSAIRRTLREPRL
ncbi:hypothetical protein NOVOSPHI9U_70024 [Novosphingobium sp. 9U]|nr:hypothetical protein NOVOSPHI9U_70024 [Novosphingobium sp. 9U]